MTVAWRECTSSGTAWTLGLVLAGCSAVASEPASTSTDNHASGSSGNSDSDTADVDSDADSDTASAEEDTGTTETGASGGTTDHADTTGSAPDQPEVQCTQGTCVSQCSGTMLWKEEQCSCDSESAPPEYVSCDLPSPCSRGDVVCVIESIRDGVVGEYRVETTSLYDDLNIVDIEVLAAGRARVHEFGWDHGCCGGIFVNEFGAYHHPQAVLAADDPLWDECLNTIDPEGTLPSCLDPESLLVGSCEPLLTQCPDTE